ncbi:MAG: hypothetical protein OEZ68_04725 [Gammaproteobacteria bacterium]|nr:hypothetical protein [Gammaproteobacteria bacterium]MDH5800091.1 hypothetical protein [Gammaproteobacteria bacterium]
MNAYKERWPIYAILLIIGIVTYVSYIDIIHHSFIDWDDNMMIVGNQHLRSFTPENLQWMFTSAYAANWHPLTWLSLTANFVTTGENPLFFKMTNILIHIFSAFVLFLISVTVLRLVNKNFVTQNSAALLNETQITGAGLLACLLFALHPQHVESVVWISERKDVLCALFYFLTILFYLRHSDGGKQSDYNMTVLCFVLAIMSKSMALTLPAVLILLDLYPLKRYNSNIPLKQNIVNILRNKWFFITTAAIVAIITVTTQRREINLETFSLFQGAGNTSIALLKYAWNVPSPIDIAGFHPYQDIVLNSSWQLWLPIFALFAIFLFTYLLYKKGVYAPAATWMFYIITVLPVSGVVPIGQAAMADRYSYIPTSGFYILLAMSAVLLWKKCSTISLKATWFTVMFVCVASLSKLTTENTLHWRNEEDLWKSVIAMYPDSADLAYSNIGAIYGNRGDKQRGEMNFLKAVQINPKNTDALKNLGIFYERNQPIIAEEYYKRLAVAKPYSSRGYITLGDFYVYQKRHTEAYEQYLMAAKTGEVNPELLMKMAYLNYRGNQYRQAIQLLEQLFVYDSKHIHGLELFALVQKLQNNAGVARKTAETLLSLQPENQLAKDVLASCDIDKCK